MPATRRRLPFADASFDVVFSYSVLQHLPRGDVEDAAGEIGRVLRPGGTAWLQMPNTFGVRNLQKQALRRFRDGTGFEVRYWTPAALRRTFARIGRVAPSRRLLLAQPAGERRRPPAGAIPAPRPPVGGTAPRCRQLPALALAADSVLVRARRSREPSARRHARRARPRRPEPRARRRRARDQARRRRPRPLPADPCRERR